MDHDGDACLRARLDGPAYGFEAIIGDDERCLLPDLDADHDVAVLPCRTYSFSHVQVRELMCLSLRPAGKSDGRDVKKCQHACTAGFHGQATKAFDCVSTGISSAYDRRHSRRGTNFVRRYRQWADASVNMGVEVD